MSTRACLVAMELEAFRGFAAPRRLDLDADAVLIRGDNGTGKTSVTDGLLWLATGAIPRLIDRTKGYRKGPDPIVNRYCDGQLARVRLSVRMTDGRQVDFERIGNVSDSKLQVRGEGPIALDPMATLADAFGLGAPTDLGATIGSWGILQQHSMLAALDEGTALHERLAEIVGLDRVTRFTASARSAAMALSAERREAEQTLAGLLDRREAIRQALHRATAAGSIEKVPLASVVRSSFEVIPDGIGASRMPAELNDVAALGREITDIVNRLETVLECVSEVRKLDTGAADAVDDLERELATAMERAQAAAARAPVQAQLAVAALELVGDTCPVCEQTIDEASVRQHLSEILDKAQAASSSAADIQRQVATSQAALIEARNAQARLSAAREVLDRAVEALHAETAEASWLAINPKWLRVERTEALLEALVGWQIQLRSIYVQARADANADGERLTVETRTLETAIEGAQHQLELAQARSERASALESATRTAAQRIVERALERLGPSFAEVYDRLSPHPTFRVLRATQDIYYKKNQVRPEVWDPVRKVGGPPTVVLSEGQLNVVALSYFLGLALNAGDSALPFIVLDDPLQAMDDLSVLGFSDLCRRIREHRQLIVTTHDRRFASLLARKLAPRETGRRTILHNFVGWTEDGPDVRTMDEPMTEVASLLDRRAS